MRIEFVGVGEAFEPGLGNTSVLLETDQTSLLVDCGYGTPANLFEVNFHKISVVYLTHFHADHCFGLPSFFARMWEEGRTETLKVVGQPGIRERVCDIVDLAYPNLREKFSYPIEFVETVDPITIGPFSLAFAKTVHPMPNYAVTVACGEEVIGVSGDGESTEASRALFSPCTTLIHEAFTLDEPMRGHGSVMGVLEFARKLGSLKQLCFVHLKRDRRLLELDKILALGKKEKFEILVPEPKTVLFT